MSLPSYSLKVPAFGATHPQYLRVSDFFIPGTSAYHAETPHRPFGAGVSIVYTSVAAEKT
jgi:hypothetical protein